MPWSMKDPPRPAKNWGKKAKKKCVAAANAVLRGGGSDQDAIYACIHAAGKTVHPHGEGKSFNSELKAILTRYLGNQVPMVEVKNMSCCDDCAAKERNMEVSMAALATAFKTIKSADPAALAALMDDQKLLKATEAMHATNLKPAELVEDRWQEGEMHRNPTKEELKTGPSMAASGGGAEKMVSTYSNVATQHGIVVEAEHFERLLQPLASSVKAQGEAISALINKSKGIDAFMAAVLKKAEEDEEEDEEDEEESEVVEINASKAKTLFGKAKKMMAAIDLLKAEMEEEEEEDDAEKRKARKAQIRKLRKALARIVAKARLHALAGKKAGLETRKSISALLKLPENRLLKADIDVVQEEEEDEEEEDEEEKAKTATTTVAAAPATVPVADKTKGPDADGNQADRKDPATGNQDDAAKSLLAMQQRVEASLNGLGMLTTDIKGMLDVVRGASKMAIPVPTLAKAGEAEPQRVSTIELIKSKIIDMAENGDLNATNELAAMDIVSNFELVKKGQMHASTVNDRLARAPTVVQDLFRGHQLDLTTAA